MLHRALRTLLAALLVVLLPVATTATALALPPRVVATPAPAPAKAAVVRPTAAPKTTAPSTLHLGAAPAAAPAALPPEIHLSRTAVITDAIRTTGRVPKAVSPEELAFAQGHALQTVQSLFHDRQGGDGALLHAVDGKIGHYASVTKLDATLTARPATRQQVDALHVLLHTFQGTDEGDVTLRGAAFEKLGAMGSAPDVATMMPMLRKPLHSDDLRAGLAAAHAILGRSGSPMARGDQHLDPQVKELLRKPQLSADERTQVIKEVLSHGEIVSISKNLSPTMNAVYFLRFKETVPGPDGKPIPIEGVWKAETTFAGKQKANFSREVAAFELAHRFTKSDIVPVTVEGLLAPDQIPGDNKPFGVGSIQYKVPGSESLGRGYPDAGLLKPKYEAYLATPDGKKQLDEIRAHLFVMNDPEKLPSPGGYEGANYGNILAVPDAAKPGGYKLFMIDNGTALGAQSQFGTSIRSDMLPNHPTETTAALSRASGDDIQKVLGPMIGDHDAADVVSRVKRATAPP